MGFLLSCYNKLIHYGRVQERLNWTVSKTVVWGNSHRGFESHLFRHEKHWACPVFFMAHSAFWPTVVSRELPDEQFGGVFVSTPQHKFLCELGRSWKACPKTSKKAASTSVVPLRGGPRPYNPFKKSPKSTSIAWASRHIVWRLGEYRPFSIWPT